MKKKKPHIGYFHHRNMCEGVGSYVKLTELSNFESNKEGGNVT